MGGIAATVHYSTQAARGYDVCQGSREQEASSFPACVGSPGIAPGTATANGGLQPDIIRTSKQVWRQSKATARRPARPERGAAVQGHSSPLRCPSHIFRCQRPAAGSHLRVVSSGSPLYPHIAEPAPCRRVRHISLSAAGGWEPPLRRVRRVSPIPLYRRAGTLPAGLFHQRTPRRNAPH